MPDSRPRLTFKEDASIEIRGALSFPELIDALTAQLGLFLARLESCERSDAGDYLLTSRRTGPTRGAKALWERVVLLSSTGIGMMMPALSPGERVRLEQAGIMIRDGAVEFARNHLPLLDVFRSLMFAIMWNETGEWGGAIAAPTIRDIRHLRDELDLHREASAREPAQSAQAVALTPPHAGQRLAVEALAWLSRAHPGARTDAERHGLLSECPAYRGRKRPSLESFKRYVREARRMQRRTSAPPGAG